MMKLLYKGQKKDVAISKNVKLTASIKKIHLANKNSIILVVNSIK